MRPTPRKTTSRRPAPRKAAVVKKPDAERELLRMRKNVRGALEDVRWAAQWVYNDRLVSDSLAEAIEKLQRVLGEKK